MSAEVEQLRAENAYLKEQIEELTQVAAVPALRAALRLTDKQARLLHVLTRRANMLTTRETVYRVVFEHPNGDGGPDLKIMDVVLCHLRAVLRDAKAPGRIETIYGAGWKVTPDLTAWVRAQVRGEDEQVAA